jgi:hypothetical protein
MARTPVIPRATPVGPLSAEAVRNSTDRSAVLNFSPVFEAYGRPEREKSLNSALRGTFFGLRASFRTVCAQKRRSVGTKHFSAISVSRRVNHFVKVSQWMIVYTFLMDKDTTEVVEILNHILAIMVTKDDLATLRSEMNEGFASVRAEMRDIRNRLDAIEAELKNHSGFAKEIDFLIERVRAIEEHLGIQHKIAA